MKVALTGGTGFIGSYLSRRLAADGHRLRVLVRETSDRAFLEENGAELIVGTLRDRPCLRQLVQGQDVVIHNGVDWSEFAADGPGADVNVPASCYLLEEARLAGVGQFIFTSTGSVYHEILQDRPLDETHPVWPTSQYGAYKAAVEAYLKAYHHRYGMNTVAFRPWGVYGLHRSLERCAWYEVVAAVYRGQTVETARGGKITHVEDLVEAMARSVGNPRVAGEIFNCVDRHIYHERVAEIARELSGSPSRIVHACGSGPRNQVVGTKVEAVLGVSFRRGEEGVRAYVAQLLAALGE